MTKEFNITGNCAPELHYMVEITEKLKQIKAMIDKQRYFTINRGRQYGKTTTLSSLRHFLGNDYLVISLSFEGFGYESFVNEETFCQKFLKNISHILSITHPSEFYSQEWQDPTIKDLDLLSDHITNRCRDKKIVLMIDEADKASNYRVFLDFLNMLRSKPCGFSTTGPAQHLQQHDVVRFHHLETGRADCGAECHRPLRR